MARTLFTADLHAFHHGIIAAAGRPFADVGDMNQALAAGWNGVVGKHDTVHVIGDFAHKAADPKKLRAFFDSLNGEKSLVIGNHDNADVCALPWRSVSQVAETTADGQRLFLSHYAHRTWPGQRRGVWQLFGHSHGRLSGSSLSTDVGVDCWGYSPVSVQQIAQRLAALPPPEAEGDDIGCDNGGPTP